MKQQISVVTLGVDDLERANKFYQQGFGWETVFQNAEIAFYQMNGLMLATWVRAKLEADMNRSDTCSTGAMALSHNVESVEEAHATLQRLVDAGGRLIRAGDTPSHGGFRGYVSDPDGHAWEIAWNPAWTIDPDGRVTFGP